MIFSVLNAVCTTENLIHVNLFVFILSSKFGEGCNVQLFAFPAFPIKLLWLYKLPVHPSGNKCYCFWETTVSGGRPNEVSCRVHAPSKSVLIESYNATSGDEDCEKRKRTWIFLLSNPSASRIVRLVV